MDECDAEFISTLQCSKSFSYMNEYLAIDRGVRLRELFTAWLNAS